MSSFQDTVVGVIPMAGHASRLGGIPFSKELYPVALSGDRITVASEHLMRGMKIAGASQFHLIIRKGKWDIPAYFGSRFEDKVPIAYHLRTYGYGVPFTVHKTYSFIRNNIVLLGFPDIIFKPENAYVKVVEDLMKTDAQVTLGLFPVTNPSKYDMVELDNHGHVAKISIKPDKTESKFAWIIAAWKPAFSDFLDQYIHRLFISNTKHELEKMDLHFGEVLIAALDEGVDISAVQHEEGKCIDLGTLEDLQSFNPDKWFS
jgi:glucose-1-phosphate thymidylyltransferase